MRLFVAIDINSNELEKDVYTLQQMIRHMGVKATYPRVNDLHLTLKFLGDVDISLVKGIIERLSRISLPPFSITVRDVGGFPNIFRPRVVFIGVDESPELKKLYNEVEESLVGLFPRETRSFKPHITIARIKQYVKIDESIVSKMRSIVKEYKLNVNCFKLKRSTLTSGGPIYDDVKIFKLE